MTLAHQHKRVESIDNGGPHFSLPKDLRRVPVRTPFLHRLAHTRCASTEQVLSLCMRGEDKPNRVTQRGRVAPHTRTPNMLGKHVPDTFNRPELVGPPCVPSEPPHTNRRGECVDEPPRAANRRGEWASEPSRTSRRSEWASEPSRTSHRSEWAHDQEKISHPTEAARTNSALSRNRCEVRLHQETDDEGYMPTNINPHVARVRIGINVFTRTRT
jgi:hypothetical protein